MTEKGRILEFPSRESRAYAFLESELSALLASKGADHTLIDFATCTLREVYSELADSADHGFAINLPAATTMDEAIELQQQIGEGIDKLRQVHHDVTVRLAARLVLTEIQLFQHRRHTEQADSGVEGDSED